MSTLVGLGILGIAAGLIALLAYRATVVFEIRAVSGKVVRARGRIPGELLRDLEDVLQKSHVTGIIRGRLEQGRVALRAGSELDDATMQRLRNVVGRFPAARIKNAPRVG